MRQEGDLEGDALNQWLVVFILLAIALGALLKGMTGLGLPLFAVPAIATVTSVEEAVVLMIIPVIGSNVWLVVSHRKHAAMLHQHRPFLAAGVVGGIIGTLLLSVIDDRWLKLLLAGWLFLYLAQYMVGDSLRFLFRARGIGAVAIGTLGGVSQGSTGMSAHIVAPYFHDPSMRAGEYAFLVATTFLLFSVAQLSSATAIGLFTPARISLGLIALIPTLYLTRLGTKLAGKLSRTAFERLVFVIFVAMEIKLLTDIF